MMMSLSSRLCRCKSHAGAVVQPRPVHAAAPGPCTTAHRPSWSQPNDLKQNTGRRSSRDVTAFAWGDDIVFTDATIVANKPEAAGLSIVTVNVGTDISSGYDKPGQFIQMKVGDSKAAFLAIANSPEESAGGLMEFLIKDSPDTTAHMVLQLGEGDKVAVSPVMGKGFPVDKVPASNFKTMLIFATGTGISPIKALIDAGALDATSRGDVRLYYGATDTDHMAYLNRIPEWELKGVQVIKVFSKRGEGYVQDVYSSANVPLADPASTCVLVCGQKEMAEGVYEKMEAEGVSRDNCLTNF